MKTIVIGAGLAGLATALKLREADVDVTLVTKGIGGLQLGQGTIDILGYHPDRVENPIEAVAHAQKPHPYAFIGADAVREGVDFALAHLDLTGSVESNYLLPTAVGAIRPTALAPKTMVAGHCEPGKKMIIAGPRQLKDFYPQLIAGNLSRTDLDGGRLEAVGVSFSLPARVGENDSSGLNYGRALDNPDYRATFVKTVKPLVMDGYTLGLPAFLGYRTDIFEALRDELGTDLFEIPLPPPSVPGMRLNETLTAAAKKARVKIVLGSEVTAPVIEGGKLTGLELTTAGRTRTLDADAVVLAAGGFESGSLTLDSYGLLSERIFGAPLSGTDWDEPTHGNYWGDPQPLFRAGVMVDETMRITDGTNPLFDNLFAAGGIIGGAIRWEDKSGDGIALGSAMVAARSIGGM